MSLVVAHAGFTAIVTKNEHHPEGYLWIDVAGKRYFLGVLERGMTRGDVKQLARQWLDSRVGQSSLESKHDDS